MNPYPSFTTKRVASNHRCPMGFAPSTNGDGAECMFCDHVVRSTCHLDYGDPHTIDDSRQNDGRRLPIRYANQTVVYRGWGWLDLVAVRRQLEERLDDPAALRATAEQLIRSIGDR